MEYEDVEINFGKVPVGKTYNKIYTPPRKIELTSVKLTKLNNHLFHVFEAKLSLDRKRILMSFTPERADQHCINYFTVVYTDNAQFTLILHGTTEEIKVELYPTSLNMISLPGAKCVRYLKLSNKSKTSTRFAFFGIQNVLTFDPTIGVLKPFDYVWVKIVFQPMKPAAYYKEIYCMIRYHMPIVVFVKAVCSTNQSLSVIYKQINYFQELWRGSDAYAQIFGIGKTRTTIPIKVYPSFLDLGAAGYSPERSTSTGVFRVECYSHLKLHISWKQEVTGAFQITPLEAVLEMGSCMEFQVIFTPNLPDKFYYSLVETRLLWGDNFAYLVPYYATVSLLGHSFDEKQCGWSPEYSISPPVVKMPPAVPNSRVYSSIMIKNNAHIPLMFKIICNKKSNFKIWPMQGIITNFQICLVQLITEKLVYISVKDQIKIRLNTSVETTIDLLGTIELPALNFSSGLHLAIAPTYVNCFNDSTIWVHNPTRLTLGYEVELKEFEKCLEKRQNEVTILHGNERHPFNITFCPKTLGDHKTSMFAITSCKKPDGEMITLRYLITVSGTAIQPSFSVFPETLMYEDIISGFSSSKVFAIQNRGAIKAYVTLYTRYKTQTSKIGDVVLKPETFSLKSNEGREVEVEITGNEIGFQEVEIFVGLHTSETDPRLTSNQKLITVTYNVVCPLLKIIDINLIKYTRIMSKYFTWHTLNISGINEGFEKLGATKTWNVNCKTPEGEVNARPVVYHLVIQNKSPFPCNYCITSLKKTHGEITFTPESGEIEEYKIATLVMEVKYNEVKLDKFYFRFSIGVKEKKNLFSLNMVIERFVITDTEMSGDIPLPSLNGVIDYHLKPVNIGNKDPPYQVIWVYNNTRAETNYNITVKGTDEKFFSIPKKSGEIKRKSFFPILVRFIPIQLRRYKVNLEVALGSKVLKVKLHSSGVISGKTDFSIPFPPNDHFEDFPVLFSYSHMVLSEMGTHSFKKIFIGIKNNANQKARFFWSKFVIGGLLSVTAEPSTGELYPGEIISCLISVRSFSFPVQLTFGLHCKVVYLETLEKWMEQRRLFTKMARVAESIFIISDNSSKVFSEGSLLNLKSEPEPIHVNVTIHVNVVSADKDVIKTDVPFMTVSGGQPKLKVNTTPSSLRVVVSSILNRIMWELLESDDFYCAMMPRQCDSYYEDYIANLNSFKPRILQPKRCFSSVIDDTLYSLVCELFQVNPYDFNMNTLYPSSKQIARLACPIFDKVNNDYFREVLMHSNTKVTVYNPKTCKEE